MASGTPVGSVRERLLKAADELFYEEGVHSVGIDRILERASVAKASLYGTFGSKDELVRAYLAGRDWGLRERVEARLAGIESPRGRVLAVFDALVERVAEGSYRGCAFVRACAEGPPGPSVAHDAAIAHRTWRRDLFAKLATELGVPDPEGASRQLSLVYDGASVGASLEGDVEAPRAARRAAETLVDQFMVAARGKPAARPAKRGARSK